MMSHKLAEMTYAELDELERDECVVILPVGATEAHGPHLPLNTDVIIAEAMADAGCRLLRERGVTALVAPPLAYTVAEYAAGFPGTISLEPATAENLVFELGRSLARHGFRLLALANAHLEPANIASLGKAAERIRGELGLAVAFPDVTRKPWALRLTDEFKSGACHAGQYEGSLVLAAKPRLFRGEIAQSLPENPMSLSHAIREGKASFEAAGGPRAYFGAPARASAEEGRATIATLAAVLCESVLEALGKAR